MSERLLKWSDETLAWTSLVAFEVGLVVGGVVAMLVHR